MKDSKTWRGGLESPQDLKFSSHYTTICFSGRSLDIRGLALTFYYCYHAVYMRCARCESIRILKI